jgi:hypothetical protein
LYRYTEGTAAANVKKVTAEYTMVGLSLFTLTLLCSQNI